MKHYAREFARNRWHVIKPSGVPLHDNTPDGNDVPVVFQDEDDAIECAERCDDLENANQVKMGAIYVVIPLKRGSKPEELEAEG